MFFVYILYSPGHNRYYVGSCEDVASRLYRHNNKMVTATKHFVPYSLMYTESYATRAEAFRREHEIKKKKSRKYIEWLLTRPD